MNTLYKYLPLQYAKKLTEKGIIKLGTLFEYQNENLHGKEIGDCEEGEINKYSLIDSLINANSNDLNKFEQKFIELPEVGQGGIIENCIVLERQATEDHYIYSTSRLFSVQLMRKISKNYHQEYNACVKIHNPNEFFEKISQKIKDSGDFKGYQRVEYEERYVHHATPNTNTHPILIKEPKYKYQEEVRAIWQPKNSKTESKILEIPELTDYCELMYVDEKKSEKGLPKIKKHNFYKDVIKIDSTFFKECTFNDSFIIYCSEKYLRLENCRIKPDCKFLFEDAALKTLSFMRYLYHNLEKDRGKEIVNQMFDLITKNK